MLVFFVYLISFTFKVSVNYHKEFSNSVDTTKIEAILAVMNTTEVIVKLRPEKIQAHTEFELRPLRYRCSAVPTELTSKLEAGHYVGYN